jgi:hypothetical protein
MARVSIRSAAVAGVLLVSGCSGKTERGIGGEAPAEKPAAGPSQVSDSKDAARPARADDQRHVLMVVELELATRAARILRARPVDMPLPRKRGPLQKLPWQVDVLDASGKVLFSAPLPDAATVRGEFPNDQGQLSGVTMQKQVAAVTLRLPFLTDASTVRVSKLDDAKGAIELGSVAYPQVKR